MATRRAEVVFVGDAASVVRAAAEAKAAIKGVQDQASKKSALENFPTLGGNITTAFAAATPAVVGLAGAIGGLAASAGAAAGGAGALGAGGIGALTVGLGSIALVAKPALANIKKVDTALDAYNLTMAKSGVTAKQAAAAHAKLNAVVSQNGGAPVLSAVKAMNALETSFQKLTAPARSTMFKGFSEVLATLKSDLPTVAGIANRSMSALVKALHGPLDMLKSSDFKGLLVGLGDTFAQIIGPAIKGASDIFLGFTRIAVAAGPYVVEFTKGFEKLAKRFADATGNSGKLNKIVGVLVSNFKSWLALGAALGKLIVDVFKHGVSSGQGMVDSLTKIVKKWDGWVKSAGGAKAITNFFQQSAQFAKNLFAALGPVVQALTTMSVGPLPVYVKLMRDLSGIMGPLTYGFVAYKLAVTGATIATTVATAATKAWALATTAWAALSKVAATAAVTWTIATEGQTAATKVATAAQILFDAAMDANPIVIVGAAVAALAAGTIYLATKTHVLSDVWGALKDTFNTVSHAVAGAVTSAFTTVKSVVTDAVGWLKGAWTDITSGVSSFASDIVSGIKSAFDGAVNVVIGFVNDIIGVIDIIPGVNIKKIGKIGGSSGSSSAAPNGQGAGGTTGGHPGPVGRASGGMLVNHPMFMVGEEAPTHPEYVIPTNPAYRPRALGLFSDLGHKLNIPGFAAGSIITPRTLIPGAGGSPISAIASGAKTVVNLAGKGAGFLLGQLPGIGSLPSWLAGMGKSILSDVGKWIKNQVSGLFGGGGSGSPSGAQGPVPAGSAKSWLTRALQITNHFSPANLAALYSRMMQESGGNPHAINLWDSNAAAGHPSKGLLQTIDGTFNQYALPGLGNIWNPIANAVAAIRYMFARYGHIVGASNSGYAKGGILGLPFAGSFKDGGRVNLALGQAGLAVVHGGETINPVPTAGSFFKGTSGLLYPLAAALAKVQAAEQTALGAQLVALKSIDAKLSQLQAWKDAIQSLGNQTKQLASQAAQVFASQRTGHINAEHDLRIANIQNGPLAKQLAAMQAQDAVTQDQQQRAQLGKAITDAQFLVDHSAGQTHVDALAQLKSAQDALTAYNRQQEEQRLQDQINAATKGADDWQQIALKGVTQQTADFQAGLDAQFSALTDQLQKRKLTYAQWAADVNAILAQYGLTVQTDSSTEATITAGPGPAAGSGSGSKSSGKPTFNITAIAIKKHPNWGGHRASGGAVYPGYAYTVGERGMETFVPDRPGRILNASQTQRNGGVVITGNTFHMNGVRGAKALADRLAWRAALGTP